MAEPDEIKARARSAPADKAVQTGAIGALLELGALDTAHDVAADALARFPDSPALRFAMARILMLLARPAEASEVLRGLCERRPELREAWEQWGASAMAAGRFADAHIAFKGAAARQPGRTDLWNGLAEAAGACGKNEDAETAWRASLALDPKQAMPLGQLGRLLMKRGAFDEAMSRFEQCIALDPAIAPAHMNLAHLLLRQKKRKEALAAAEEAVRLAPHRADTHLTLGQVLLDLNWCDGAAGAFEKAIERDGTNEAALLGLATAHARSDRLGEAVATADRLLALRPEDGQVLHMRRTWAGETVGAAPDDYVRRLFDSVAKDFESHLQTGLSYDVPERAAALLAARYAAKDRFRSLCDVGCGTGLMAKALAPRYTIPDLIGIDLAPRMLEQARAKGLYTDLIAGEAVATLAAMARTFDIITAMDVLIYMGDGAPFLRAAAARLTRGGVLALSLETREDISDVRLELTTRFAHNKDHFIGLAAACGLVCVRDENAALRREAGEDVRGCILIFERG